MIYFILALVFGVFLNIFVAVFSPPKRRNLQSRLMSLGILRGKSKNQVFKVLGEPQSVSETPGGKVQMHWSESGYDVSLIFRGDTCEGVSRRPQRSA
jgi:hypothetical protein